MRYLILLVFVIVATAGCKKDGTPVSASESYLPMEVGNYWRINDENYTKITGTKMIDGELFYEFSSRVGGDAFGKNYYRLDEMNTLIEKFPQYPGAIAIVAKFNSKVGDSFYMNEGKDSRDLIYVTMTRKDDNIATFGYDLINHPNLKGQKSFRSFKKGFGFDEQWKEVKIGDKLYRF